LLLVLNTGIVFLGGLAKRILIDGKEPGLGPIPDLWTDIYEVSIE